MSRDNHPAGRNLPCRFPGCQQPAQARIAAAHGPHVHYVTILPVTSRGVPACLDCAHTAVDIMLLRAMPEPTR